MRAGALKYGKSTAAGVCRWSKQLLLPALQCQKLFFYRKSATVTCELAVRADHAMARNDDWNGIRSIGQANCAAGIRVTDALCELTVRNRLPIRNETEFSPHFLLKRSALGRKRQVEMLKLSPKIGAELANRFSETR
jgi:hypothetical protein